MTHPDTSTY